ncbi:hypothetical protein [Vulcanisaeta thermophila]|uniref:hypothetical protein n=1 Tax=Vulcanisaeta thermophila TaxID=867917 RepID=UPI00085389E1|nr:hypothetical protein [Vulcanisaeta thermophila]
MGDDDKQLEIEHKEEVIGQVERAVLDGDNLILTINSHLSHNTIMRMLSRKSIILIRNEAGNELLTEVRGIEALAPIPPSIPEPNRTRIRIVAKPIALKTTINGRPRYVRGIIIPAMGSAVIEPGMGTIMEALDLRGDVTIGKAIINNQEVPIKVSVDELVNGLYVVSGEGDWRFRVIMNILRNERLSKEYESIIIMDRSGKYVGALIHGELCGQCREDDKALFIPVDLARLERAVDMEEVVKYIMDRLRIAGLRGKVKVKLTTTKRGIKLTVNTDRGYGFLTYPTTISTRWFMEEIVEMGVLGASVNYVLQAVMSKGEGVDSIGDFINKIQNEVTTPRASVIKTLNLLMRLKRTGYFDLLINIRNKTMKPPINPLGILGSKFVVYDLHEMPMELMNTYQLVLMKNVLRWFITEGRRALLILDDVDGIIRSRRLLNEFINLIRLKNNNVAMIISSRVNNGEIRNHVGSTVMTGSMPGDCVGAPTTDKPITLITPTRCITGSLNGE